MPSSSILVISDCAKLRHAGTRLLHGAQAGTPRIVEVERRVTDWKYRVAVGAATGPQSGVWRFWTWNDDVYVALRSIGHVLKVSLHQSGVWQAGLTSEAPRARNIDPSTRSWDRWRRPPEFAMGTVKAFQIIIPSSEVTWPRVIQPAQGKVEWLPRPPEGYCTYVTAVEFV